MAWKTETRKFFECDRCHDEFSEKQIGCDVFFLKSISALLRSTQQGEKSLLEGLSFCPPCAKSFLINFIVFMNKVESDFDDRLIIDGDPTAEKPLGVITHSQYVPSSNDDTPSMEDEIVDDFVEEAAWIVIKRAGSPEFWAELCCELSVEEITQRVKLTFSDPSVLIDIDRSEESARNVATFIKELAEIEVKKGR